jgi:hypothetical protein
MISKLLGKISLIPRGLAHDLEPPDALQLLKLYTELFCELACLLEREHRPFPKGLHILLALGFNCSIPDVSFEHEILISLAFIAAHGFRHKEGHSAILSPVISRGKPLDGDEFPISPIGLPKMIFALSLSR